MDDYINSLSLAQLEELSRTIKKKIAEHKEDLDKHNIIDNVEKSGYFCSPKDINIPELKKIGLTYYVKYLSYDKEDQNDAHIIGAYETQKEWVNELGFKYEPTSDDDCDMDGEWESGDWDDPITCRGSMSVYLYYKSQPIPPPNTPFRGIEEFEDDINTYIIKDNNVYLGCNESDTLIGPIDKWDKFSIYNLDEE